ncbi:MAG: nucleoside deaminase [Solirubrobacterales bacterium]
MSLALEEARSAAGHGDTPVGAAIYQGETLLAAAGNRREIDGDPTAHAELLVIREAARGLGGWRLPETTLYVTLEPCAMCAGAIVLARPGPGTTRRRRNPSASWPSSTRRRCSRATAIPSTREARTSTTP